MIPLAASDETAFGQVLATWNAFDERSKSLVARANVHGYQPSAPAREAYATALGERLRWNSEHGDGDATGLSTARELSLDLNVLRVAAWCYWQPLDGGGWGFLDCDMPSATIKKVNPKLFVLAPYTRHVRPGMAILTWSRPTARSGDEDVRPLGLSVEASSCFPLGHGNEGRGPLPQPAWGAVRGRQTHGRAAPFFGVDFRDRRNRATSGEAAWHP